MRIKSCENISMLLSVNSYFFVLVSVKKEYWKGIYFELITSYSSKNSYVP